MSLAQLQSNLENARNIEAEASAAIDAELEAAKAAYDEWDAPRRRYRDAIAAKENLSSGLTRERAEAELRRHFAPFVDGHRARLAREVGRTSASYVKGFESVLHERMAAIRAAIAKLDSMHLDTSITDPEAAVNEYIENLRLPLLPAEVY